MFIYSKILRNRVGEPVAIDQILALGLGELSRHVNPQRYTQEFYTLLDMYWDENSNEDILDFCKDLMNFTLERFLILLMKPRGSSMKFMPILTMRAYMLLG